MYWKWPEEKKDGRRNVRAILGLYVLDREILIAILLYIHYLKLPSNMKYKKTFYPLGLA
jgi:hypothetical protein